MESSIVQTLRPGSFKVLFFFINLDKIYIFGQRFPLKCNITFGYLIWLNTKRNTIHAFFRPVYYIIYLKTPKDRVVYIIWDRYLNVQQIMHRINIYFIIFLQSGYFIV